jgi:hypothetical protein
MNILEEVAISPTNCGNCCGIALEFILLTSVYRFRPLFLPPSCTSCLAPVPGESNRMAQGGIDTKPYGIARTDTVIASFFFISFCIFSCDQSTAPTPVAQHIIVKQNLTRVTSGDWLYEFPNVTVIDGSGRSRSDAVTIGIYNAGQNDLTILGVDLSSGDIGDFDIDTPALDTTVVSLDYTTFDISFDPVAALGSRTAEVSIRSDDVDEPTVTFSVRGFGVKSLNSVARLPVSDFGRAVAISGDVALVATDDGAHVFYRDFGGPGEWGEVKYLASDAFSVSVAVGSDVAIAGNQSDYNVYLFYKDQGGIDNWGAGITESIYGGGLTQFGRSLALSGDTLVIGAPLAQVLGHETYGQGYARIYYRTEVDSWSLAREVTASDGGFQEYFGSKVAISGDTACIAQRGGYSPGAYFFYKDHEGLDNWGEVRKLKRADLGVSTNGDFARGIAISGDLAVIGVPGDIPGDEGSSGAIYILSRNNGGTDNWGLVKKIVSDEGIYSFGENVALSGDLLAVASYSSVYIHSRNQGGSDNWGLVKRLSQREDEDSQELFGYSVAISRETVLIGAPWYAGETSPGTGAAYIWEP